MKNPFTKDYVVQLFGQKDSYVESGRENLRLSNEMSSRFHTLVSTIILAQLAFLGTLGLDHEQKILSAIITTILITSLTLCLVAISWQQIGILKGVKHYFQKADKISELIKETKKDKISFDDFPDDLRAENIMKFTKIPNRLFMSGFLLSIAGSTLLVLMIWSLVL